jgi:3-isopropylmalate dehydrogenase
MADASSLIETAVRQVLRAGWRTMDIAESGCRVVGTREMGRMVADAVNQFAKSNPVAA